jgi:hypothetical protein
MSEGVESGPMGMLADTIRRAVRKEPCLEPAAIKFLDRVQELANRGEIGELEKLGEVYVRRAG